MLFLRQYNNTRLRSNNVERETRLITITYVSERLIKQIDEREGSRTWYV